jgi:hypothetical protein
VSQGTYAITLSDPGTGYPVVRDPSSYLEIQYGTALTFLITPDPDQWGRFARITANGANLYMGDDNCLTTGSGSLVEILSYQLPGNNSVIFRFLVNGNGYACFIQTQSYDTYLQLQQSDDNGVQFNYSGDTLPPYPSS